MTDDHAAVHDLAAPYALDALDTQERDRFERHLATCAACRAEVRDLLETVAVIGAAETAAPPPALRRRVLEQARHQEQEPPTVPGQALPPRRTARAEPALRRWGYGLAAALLIGLGIVAVAALQPSPAPLEQVRVAAAEGDTVRVEELLADFGDDLAVDSVTTDAGVTARLVRSDEGSLLLTAGLPTLPPARTYQAWRIGDAGPESAGVLGRSGDPVADLGPVDAGTEAVAVSIEPAGGSAQPGDDIVVVVPVT